MGAAEIAEGRMTTVWIYVDTSKQVGDRDQIKAFARSDNFGPWIWCPSLRLTPKALYDSVVSALSAECDGATPSSEVLSHGNVSYFRFWRVDYGALALPLREMESILPLCRKRVSCYDASLYRVGSCVDAHAFEVSDNCLFACRPDRVQFFRYSVS